MKKERKHDVSLERLVNRLSDIGQETPLSVITEPVWLYKDNYGQHKLCDMILIYHSGDVPVELKASFKYMLRAKEQLRKGKLYIHNVLKHEYMGYGVYAVYNKDKYLFKRINL